MRSRLSSSSRGLAIVATGIAVVVFACGGSVSPIESNGSSGGSSGSSGTSGSSGASSSGSSGANSDASVRVEDGGIADGAIKKDADPPNDPRCPKTFVAPPGNCDVGVACKYDQGSCECLGYCGGPPPPPDEDMSHWGCTPKRTDGCPDDRPKDGTACNNGGQVCTYGSCCVEKMICGGTSGKWVSGGLDCPG